MHHAVGVGIRHGVGDVAQHADRLGDRELADALEPLAQRRAVDKGHHIEELPGGLPRIVQRQDMRMRERGGDVDLSHEAVGAEQGPKLFAQDLDRHLSVVLEVLGEVHGGHAASPELAIEPVAVGERSGELIHLHTLDYGAEFVSRLRRRAHRPDVRSEQQAADITDKASAGSASTRGNAEAVTRPLSECSGAPVVSSS